MYILNYYDESTKRRNTREYILRCCRKYFSLNNQQDASITDIAKYLKIERRTLYYYYKNKDDLVLDVYLYFSEKFCEDDLTYRSNVFTKNEYSTYKDALKEYFRGYVERYAAEQEKSASIIDIDQFVYNLEDGTRSFERYMSVISEIRNGYSDVVELFEKAILANEFKVKFEDAKLTFYMIEQVLRTYIVKRWSMRKFNDVYSIDNLNRIIEILIDGL